MNVFAVSAPSIRDNFETTPSAQSASTTGMKTIFLKMRTGKFAMGATMSKHTPGPWKKGEFRYRIEQAQAKESGFCKRIANINFDGWDGPETEAEAEANSRLIASAPDLLAACKRALLGFENTPPTNNEDRYEPMMVLIAAIAKVEGKS